MARRKPNKRIELDRRALLAAVDRVGRVIPTRACKPILSCVRLAANDDTLQLATTDLSVTITATVPCTGDLPATVVVCRELQSRLKLAKSTTCTLEYDAERNGLVLNGGRADHVLPTMPASDFPPCNIEPLGQKLCARSDELQPGLKTCLRAAANDPSRYALDAVLLESDSDGVRLVATDGRRLAEHRLESVTGDLCGQTLIPGSMARLLSRLVDPKHDEAVAVHVEHRVNEKGIRQQSRIVASGHDWRVASEEPEGTFPHYHDLMPQTGSRFVVDREEFIELVSEVAEATSMECKAVRLDLKRNSLTVSAKSPDNGESTGSIPATFTGLDDDHVITGFNPAFLLDAARTVPGNMFVIDVRQNKHAVSNNTVISGPGLFYGHHTTLPRWLLMSVNLGLEPGAETLGRNWKPGAAVEDKSSSAAA